MEELIAHLSRVEKQLRITDGWYIAQRTFWLPGLATVLISMAGRITPIRNLAVWVGAPVILWAICVSLWAMLHRQNQMQVAQRVDIELDSRDTPCRTCRIDSKTWRRLHRCLLPHPRSL